MMNIQRLNLMRLSGAMGAVFLIAPLLVACSKSVPVSIHGVNYTVEPFSYVVTDPNDPKNTGGGELIEPYAAGGTMCCYELPRKWQPGTKVSVRSVHWLGKSADDSLRQVVTTHLVEVPRYADGKPGELWVLRSADGRIDLVSSDFQPNHPKWPGKVKGWPAPSLAYQRERYDIHIKHQQDFLNAYRSLQEKFKVSPDEATKEAWEFAIENDKKSLDLYAGPHDPKYRKMLKNEYEQGITEILAEIDRLQKGRP